jgi:hypothetical protein
LENKVIVTERLDEKSAKRCNCLLIRYELQDDDHVDNVLDTSLELTLAVNDIAKRRVVKFLGVIFHIGDDHRHKRPVIEDFVAALQDSHLPGIPATFVFLVGSRKNVSFNFNGNGRRWWHCVNSHAELEANRFNKFVQILERQFSRCPAYTTNGVVKLLIGAALPSLFADGEFQCLLHRAFDDNDEFLPLFLTCAQISTVRIVQTRLGYDVDGIRAPIWCLVINDSNVPDDINAICELVYPGNAYKLTLKECVRTIELSSLSTVAIHSVSLMRNATIVCWKRVVYILPRRKDPNETSRSSCSFMKAFLDGFSSCRR